MTTLDWFSLFAAVVNCVAALLMCYTLNREFSFVTVGLLVANLMFAALNFYFAFN